MLDVQTFENSALLIGRVAFALALGFLIGLERGWRQRDVQQGERSAGVRTFAMYGLLGGISGVLPGDWAMPAGLLGGSLLITAGYLASLRQPDPDRGMTSEAAAIVTLALGAMAGRGEMMVAAAGAVMTLLLLDLKRPLHAFLQLIRDDEIQAALKLLALSVLVLPFLPDRDFGPGGVLNLYSIWWAVILVATLSFAGYIAIRTFGAQRGPLVFGLVGGLASSTAVTVTASRLARPDPALATPFAGAIGLASAVMMTRVAVLLALITPQLFLIAWPPLAAGAAASAIAALAISFSGKTDAIAQEELQLKAPADYWFAVVFGLVLAAIGVGVYYAEIYAGDAGLYAIAAISGPLDADAFTLSVARSAGSTTTLRAACDAVLLSAAVNTLGKAVIAWSLGGRALALRVAAMSSAAIAAGAATWLVI